MLLRDAFAITCVATGNHPHIRISCILCKGLYSKKVYILRCKPFFFRAGAEGVEPSSAVLETDVKPFNYAPM